MNKLVNVINKKENIFNDNIAYVEYWDFSRANLNQENRVNAITQVASICYQNPKALNSDSLYNRLAAESIGLPSSAFEFVSVLLDPAKEEHKLLLGNVNSKIRKFGEFIEENGKSYLLTNYRAVVYDFEERISSFDAEKDAELIEDLRKKYLELFNTEEECEIMSKHFKVFRYHVDLPTRSQMVRHRASWQELSRRYVSGKRTPFEFYISENMKDVWSKQTATMEYGDKVDYTSSTQNIIDNCLEHYYKALEDGVKPQEARRIIPQAGYSQIWAAFMPMHLENYFKLRLDSHAQWEIRKTAEAMKELLGK
jgi:thymidylate synthase (FAD)